MCGSLPECFRVLGRRLNRSQGIRPCNKVGIATTVSACTECGLIFSDPMPVPTALDQHYSSPPESYWKPEYFNLQAGHFKDVIDQFFALTQFDKAEQRPRAFDVGAGIGKSMIAMEKAGFETLGIEPIRAFHERAINQMGVDKNRLQLISLEECEFPENEFHFITFGAVLEHLYDPSKCILKTMRWLKPGGLIHIEVPSSRWLMHKLYNLIYRIQGLDYVANISPMHPPFHYYEFGLKSFHRHASTHGYEIALKRFHVCTDYRPKFLRPLMGPIMRLTNTGMQLEIWLRKPL